MMGPIVPDGSEGPLNKETLTRLAEKPASFTPWRVEGLVVPDPQVIEENDAHRIVLPPIDSSAPSLIDEVVRLRA
jgi:hypothetical protein